MQFLCLIIEGLQVIIIAKMWKILQVIVLINRGITSYSNYKDMENITSYSPC